MPDARDIDLGLKFLHQAVGMPSLHFGLFTDGMRHDIDGLREAQQEYSRTLASLVPEKCESVLDVGCGVGDISKMLKEKGFRVEGLSPDEYHGEQYRKTCGEDVPFHLSRFEDFSPGRKFDCLLFGESPQYIEKDAFFPKAVELTEPGAFMVLAEFFQRVPNEDYEQCFLLEDFLKRAGEAGFEVDFERDITEDVLPNLTVSNIFLGYGQRLFEFVEDTASRRSPFVWRLAKIFYRRKLRNVHELLTVKLPRRLDPDLFRKNMRYMMFRLVRKQPGEG